jgi:hypothetical protein
MRNLILISFCLLTINSCGHNQKKIIANKDFLVHLDEYIKYVDSSGSYKNNHDYIYLEAIKSKDTTKLIITLVGGSYEFLKHPYRTNIIDFFNYRGYKILLIGDFPNDIIQNKLNENLNIDNEIVKKYYPEDYSKWQKDSLSVGPLIYDYMGIFLTYKNNNLIYYHKQYY